MTGFSLGPMRGVSMTEAADIVMGESGHLPAIPQLPERGLGADAVGSTAALLEAVNVDRGPRAWQMTQRPQLMMRRTWDLWERDLDAIQEVWGESVPALKMQVLGPWSLAAAVELANGHRVLSDAGATRDLHEALQMGIADHMAKLQRRFHGQVRVQVDEPLLGDVLTGKVPGTTDFDEIRAIPAEVVREKLKELGADYLVSGTHWEIADAAETFVTDFLGLDTAKNIDGLGEFLSEGKRIGFAIAGVDARAEAVAVARHFDRMGMPRELLVDAVDVVPREASASTLRSAVETAGMLVRDAGDL